MLLLSTGCELQIDCSAAEGIPASDYVVVSILLFLSAMFSGLTLGLMSLDLIGLEIVVKVRPFFPQCIFVTLCRQGRLEP